MKIAKTVSSTFILLILLLTVLLMAKDNYSAVPKKINYQGYITNSEGIPLAGNIEMTFSIYETYAGGVPVWTETLSVEVTDGIINIILGESNPLDPLTDKQYYLGIKVGTDDEMTPRRTLASVISSIFAEKAVIANQIAITCEVGQLLMQTNSGWACGSLSGSTCNHGDSVLCYTGAADTMNKGACKTGYRYCNPNGMGYGECIGDVVPQSEICDNKDNDCNGVVDDGIAATSTSCGVGGCASTGQMFCQNGNMINTCAIKNIQQEGPLGHPSCSDGVDNDCDGLTDTADYSCLNTWCVDNDYDGYGANGDTFCPNGSANDCNDYDVNINPGKKDANCNGIDDNCNGQIDEGYLPTSTNCGIGVCSSTGHNICQNGSIINICTPKTPTENKEATCSDNIDNDCDGKKDLNDVDCQIGNYAIDFSRTSNQAGIIYSGANIAQQPFTIETWVKKKTDGFLNGNILTSYNSGIGISLYVKDNVPKLVSTNCHGSPTSTSCIDGTYTLSVSSLIELVTNIWTHIVALVTNDNHSSGPNDCATVGAQQPHLALYVNGELKNCGSTNSKYPSINGTFHLGAQNIYYDGLDSNSKFMGAIDDVRIWTVARTQSEIKQCMNQTLGSSAECNIDPAKLSVYWPLNEGFGTTAHDVSGNNKNGLIFSPFNYPWGYGWIHDNSREICDGLDNDGNGLLDDIPVQQITCGLGACASTGQYLCQNGFIINTCLPGEPLQEGPFGDHTCSDGFDNDCDGTTDKMDGNCIGCYSTDETCDGLDDDCDGIKDDDYIATQSTCGIGVCMRTGSLICQNGVIVNACTPGTTMVYEGPIGSPLCSDSLDNDCDGTTDGADSGCTSTCNPIFANDVTCDGIDDNCNGQIDEGFMPTSTSCGLGVCSSTGQTICQNGSIINTCTPKTPTENKESTCSDNIDNDCDGTKDSDDVDCYINNYAIDFSRSINQAGIISAGANIAQKPFTIETWLKKKTDGNLNGNIISKFNGYGGTPPTGIAVYAKNDMLKILFKPTSTLSYYTSCGESLLTNIWTHLVAVLTNENHSSGPNNCSTFGAEQPHLACYVNGELKNCGSTNRQFISNNEPPLNIGMQNIAFDGLDSNTKFMGAIDDVRLWTVARTQAEIQQCMNQTLGSSTECTIDPAKLEGYWPFNEGFGSTAHDVSGHNLNGTIYSPLNTPWSNGWTVGYPLVLP